MEILCPEQRQSDNKRWPISIVSPSILSSEQQRCATERSTACLLRRCSLETNVCPTQAHVEKAVSVEVVWSLEHVIISDGEHNDGKIKKTALRVSPVRSLDCKDGSPDRTIFGLKLASNQQKKAQQGAQQHVLLVDVCLETQTYVEISVSVEVIWSLENVLISDGEHNIKNNQEDSTSQVLPMQIVRPTRMPEPVLDARTATQTNRVTW